GLKVVRTMMSFEAEFLATSGAANKLITSWVAIAGPLGISRKISSMTASGKIEFEEWSHMGILLRFLAGSMGVPFLPTYTMLGSDLVKGLNVKQIESPFDGEKVLLVPAINPDVSIIHVQRADQNGNAQILGMPIQDREIALSAKKVIITAEEIVSEDYIRQHPSETTIPHFAVDAVVEAPFGAYPTECQGFYEADIGYLSTIASADRAEGGIEKMIDEIIYKKESFMDFLNTIKPETLIRLGMTMRLLTNGDT
ncbi:MAG: CoA-transferase, partial [Candidatus Micrarchaeaceae archaeon]